MRAFRWVHQHTLTFCHSPPFLSTRHFCRSRNFFSVFLHHPPQPLLRFVGTFLGFLCFFGKAVSLNSSFRSPSGNSVCMCVEFQAQTIYWFSWNVFVAHRALDSNTENKTHTQTQIVHHPSAGESDCFHSQWLSLPVRLVLTSPDLFLQERASSSNTVCFTSGLSWVTTSLLSVHATFCLSHRARSRTTFCVVVSRNVLLLNRRPEKETPCHKKLYWTPKIVQKIVWVSSPNITRISNITKLIACRRFFKWVWFFCHQTFVLIGNLSSFQS